MSEKIKNDAGQAAASAGPRKWEFWEFPEDVYKNQILVNHVGFMPAAAKRCVILKPPLASERKFAIHQLTTTKCVWKQEQVVEGILINGGPELEPGLVGDFSMLQTEGIYQVRCGPLRSRCFIVYKHVYDVPLRVLFNYFPWQRCGGSRTGWAAPCHLDDGRIAETGEHRDLAGGYHQSCDLRKWASFTPLGLLGLIQFAQHHSPRWDDGCIAEEIRWGCDYYHKLVREDGGLLDSVFIPPGWGARDFYKSDSPAPAHWNTIRHQAMAAAYFQTRDPVYAEKCRQIAWRVWKYMTSVNRPKGKYHAPALPPVGHDGMNEWFAGFYEGSALDLSHRLCAAVALHRIGGDLTLLEDAANCAAALLKLQTTQCDANRGDASICFWQGTDSEKLADSEFYIWHTSAPLGLCDLLELLPEHPDAPLWRRAVEQIAERHCRTARRNPWGLIAANWFIPSPLAPISEHTYNAGSLSARNPAGTDLPVAYRYRPAGYNLDIAAAGIFLGRAAAIFGKDEYRGVAQRQLDWILGGNPFDSSSVEGVGYNQPHRGIFGEFFPPTPQIPGAVSLGLQSGTSFGPEYYGFTNEYDLPIVGWVLGFMSELAVGAPDRACASNSRSVRTQHC